MLNGIFNKNEIKTELYFLKVTYRILDQGLFCLKVMKYIFNFFFLIYRMFSSDSMYYGKTITNKSFIY